MPDIDDDLNGEQQPPSAAVRKAAILVSTLDTRAADALLDKMPEAFADQVRAAVFQLGDVDRDEQNEVIQEFMAAGGMAATGPDNSGVELELSLHARAPAEQTYQDASPASADGALREPPFSFLRQATGDVLARHLSPQHPQVIAVVAAHLPPDQAADFIKRLAPRLQADVLRRVAELDPADDDVLRDLEAELQSRLRDDLRAAQNRQTGIANVLTILESAGADRGTLFTSLARHQQDLAEQLRRSRRGTITPASASRASTSTASSSGSPLPPRPVNQTPVRETVAASASETRHRLDNTKPTFAERHDEVITQSVAPLPSEASRNADDGEAAGPELEFDDLTSLPDESWARLIRSIDPNLMLLALTGASDQLMKRITQRLSRQEAQVLRSRLHATGPVRLSDIEEAQRQVAQLASRLAARGALTIPLRRGFAAAA